MIVTRFAVRGFTTCNRAPLFNFAAFDDAADLTPSRCNIATSRTPAHFPDNFPAVNSWATFQVAPFQPGRSFKYFRAASRCVGGRLATYFVAESFAQAFDIFARLREEKNDKEKRRKKNTTNEIGKTKKMKSSEILTN